MSYKFQGPSQLHLKRLLTTTPLFWGKKNPHGKRGYSFNSAQKFSFWALGGEKNSRLRWCEQHNTLREVVRKKCLAKNSFLFPSYLHQECGRATKQSDQKSMNSRHAYKKRCRWATEAIMFSNPNESSSTTNNLIGWLACDHTDAQNKSFWT